MKTNINSSESTVTLTLTKEQYRDLVKVVYLGNWFINSWRAAEEVDSGAEEIEQTVYKQASNSKLPDLIEFNDELSLFLPTEEMEDEMLDLIDDYNDALFWKELSSRLAERDLSQLYSDEQLEKMEFDDALKITLPFMQKYLAEFEEHGIERLNIPLSVVRQNLKIRPS